MTVDKMNINLAAPCGLYCGDCVKFKKGSCGGCHSNNHFSNHKGCRIYKCCVSEKGLKWCFECKDFPCAKIENFAKWRTWIDHRDCIKNLKRMKEVGVDRWLQEKELCK